jgi:hypothetical protein
MRPHLLIPVLVLAAALAACKISTPDFDIADDAPDADVLAHCSDQEQNEGETDLNCGGPCPPCELGQMCAAPGDCVTGFCNENTSRCEGCVDQEDCDHLGLVCADDGICKLPLGAVCETADACASGYCASVCCDRGCGGSLNECESCVAASTGLDDGTCGPVADRIPCGGGYACEDGDVIGNMCLAGLCEETVEECGAYACSDASGPHCLTSCDSTGGCTAGNYCDSAGACMPLRGPGEPCDVFGGGDGGGSCLSGVCQDGTCQ